VIDHAPGFVRVRDLDPDPRFAQQVLDGFREGVFVLRREPPSVTAEVPSFVRGRKVLTSALHRSYRVATSSFDDPEFRERLWRLAFTERP